MISFVNLIRRRSFFVITANHYSVGRLNKQANKIINGERERERTKQKEREKKRQESRRNKTEASQPQLVPCAAHTNAAVNCYYLSKRNI